MRQQGRQKRSFFSILIRIVAIALAFLVGFGAAIYFWLGKSEYTPVTVVDPEGRIVFDAGTRTDQEGAYQAQGKVPVHISPDHPIVRRPRKHPAVRNYLIVGTDSRGEEEARTDSMMILSVDARNRVIKLSSLMRDIEVDLGDYGARSKLNAAYVYGGIGYLINVINKYCDLDIEGFMLVDFWSAMKIVDDMGGVDLTVTEAEVEAVNIVMQEMNNLLERDPGTELLTTAGPQTLTGAQAIAWARVRSVGSDHARTGRQRALVGAVLAKFGSINPLKRLSAATTVIEDMQTNLRPGDLMKLGLGALISRRGTLEYKVPADESFYTTDGDNWNIIVDWDRQRPALHNFIYEVGPEDQTGE